MNFLKKIFGKKAQPEAVDSVPYFWGPEALPQVNAMLNQQVEELDTFTSKLA